MHAAERAELQPGYNKHEMCCCGGNIFEATLSTLWKGSERRVESGERTKGDRRRVRSRTIDGILTVVIRHSFGPGSP